MNPKIEESWKSQLMDQFEAPYFQFLREFLIAEKQQQTVYPPGGQIFNAFDFTPFEAVKVVILGQDPYHGPGQAHGLSFSVPSGVAPPPSLVNIFKELNTDLGNPIPKGGNLESWARQGVLLLNATLTVRARQAGSHQKQGWETFTDAVIKRISDHREGVVFLLWGKFAQAKSALINADRHHILTAPHPSPFSAHYGFFGCKHFSQANQLLEQQGLSPIDWSVA
ncbi:MAG: uracil-DNA glycosylase [Salibacteraceae bacterium]